MPITQDFLTLNNAGNHPDNPILPHLQFKMYYHRHDATEEFWKLWVQIDGEIHTELTQHVYTGAGVEYGSYVIPIDSSIDLKQGVDNSTGPVLNKIIWTTSHGARVVHIYVAQEPDHDILINGYDAGNAAQPLLDPIDASAVPARDEDYEYPY